MFGKKKQIDNSQPMITDDGFSDFFDDEGADTSEQPAQTYQDNNQAYQSNEQANAQDYIDLEEKPVQQTKKKKAGKLGKMKPGQPEDTDEVIEKRKMMMFVIIDRNVDGLLEYFRQSGVNVSNIFYDITEAKNEVLMQTEPLRIVIIDTGLGKFTTTTMRGELIDMLGISDEQNRTSVFYTDSVLKVDTLRSLGKSGKAIDWNKYESTALVAATLLRYNEEYILDSESDKITTTKNNEGLNFTGMRCGIPDVPRMDIRGFSKDAIIAHVLSDTDDCIQGFEINI